METLLAAAMELALFFCARFSEGVSYVCCLIIHTESGSISLADVSCASWTDNVNAKVLKLTVMESK